MSSRILETGEIVDFPRLFHALVQRQLTAGGLYPQHVMWRRGLTFRHETSYVPNKAFLSMVTDLIVAQPGGISELIFGIDVKNDKELQLEFDWGIALGYLRDFNWRFGIIAYNYDQRIVRGVDWNNQVVIKRLTAMVKQGLECHAKRRSVKKVEPQIPYWIN